MITKKEWADIREALETTDIFYDFKYKVNLAHKLEKFVEELDAS